MPKVYYKFADKYKASESGKRKKEREKEGRVSQITFSGRWNRKDYEVHVGRKRGKHRRVRYDLSFKQASLTAMISIAAITALLISSAFANSMVQKAAVEESNQEALAPTYSDADWAVAPEDATSDNPNATSEYEAAWAARVHELSVQQQEEMARKKAEEERARQEALRQAQQAQALAQMTNRNRNQAPSNSSLTGASDVKMAITIDSYLQEKGSPMTGFGATFVSAGKIFGVDPYLVVAIAGKESSWGKDCFKPYNAWGWGDSSWTDWTDAINNYTRSLSEEYISKGITTIPRIAPIYCPPNYVSWANDVTLFHTELTTLEQTVR